MLSGDLLALAFEPVVQSRLFGVAGKRRRPSGRGLCVEETWSHCGTVGAPPLVIDGCQSQLCLCHQMPRAKGNLCLSLVSLWSWDWPHGLRAVGIQHGAPADGKRDRPGPNRPVAAPTPTLLKPPPHAGAFSLLPGSSLCTAVHQSQGSPVSSQAPWDAGELSPPPGCALPHLAAHGFCTVWVSL